MWSYYGSKFKLIKYYPKPKYDIIIEPFAGAAWYSCNYSDKQVYLNEKYDVIYNIWRWLINEATEDEILSYSKFYLGEDISDLPIRQEHKDLIGFCINRGSSSPKRLVQKWSCQSQKNPLFASTTYSSLVRIANNLSKIRHWKCKLGDYTELPDIEATWFIDPPYQNGGKFYIENKIDYSELGRWCRSRKGQIIVCETTRADWLDFQPIKESYGQKNNNAEAMWYNETQ